jgi:hypothetical protein
MKNACARNSYPVLASAFFRLSGRAESAVGFRSAIAFLGLARRAMFFLRLFNWNKYAACEQNARHRQQSSYFSHHFSDQDVTDLSHLRIDKKQPTLMRHGLSVSIGLTSSDCTRVLPACVAGAKRHAIDCHALSAKPGRRTTGTRLACRAGADEKSHRGIGPSCIKLLLLA